MDDVDQGQAQYEQGGGPGMQKCLQLLQGSADREDTILFLLTQLALMLMAATDGHAKNFSIYLDRGDAYRMTPLYDVLRSVLLNDLVPAVDQLGQLQLLFHSSRLARG